LKQIGFKFWFKTTASERSAGRDCLLRTMDTFSGRQWLWLCVVITRFRSYPVPDKYSVTLEISRDRTTAVKQAPCLQTRSTAALCTFDLLETGPATPSVYRAVNEPCTKLVGGP